MTVICCSLSEMLNKTNTLTFDCHHFCTSVFENRIMLASFLIVKRKLSYVTYSLVQYKTQLPWPWHPSSPSCLWTPQNALFFLFFFFIFFVFVLFRGVAFCPAPFLLFIILILLLLCPPPHNSFFFFFLVIVFKIFKVNNIIWRKQTCCFDNGCWYRPFPQVRREFGIWVSPLADWDISSCHSTEASAWSFHSTIINF